MTPNFHFGLGATILVLLCYLGPLVQGDEEAKPAECIFPFTYLGKEFTECTDLNGGRPWCATTKVYNGSWVYCAKKVGDLITNDHFLTILEQAKNAENKIKAIAEAQKSKTSSCSDCMESFLEIQKWVDTQTRIYMDQNRRLQGIQKRVQTLIDLKAELKKYRQRRHCRQTANGGDYLGHKDKSSSGKTCQVWTSQSPHRHEMTDNNMFPDNKVSRAKNYCRNPNNAEKPWCFTVDGRVGSEGCNIPRCNIDCKIDVDNNSPLPLCDEFADMTCPSGYQYFKNTCYKVELNHKRSWSDAEKVCSSEGGHLASVDSYSENRYIASLLPSGKRVWLGGTDEGHEGRWTWSTGKPVMQSFWHTGEPNNYRFFGFRRSENCLIMGWYSSTPWGWNDYDCEKSEGFICAIDATPGDPANALANSRERKCDNDYKILKDRCYKAETSKTANWQDAEKACSSQGGHLASVRNPEENNFIASLIPRGNSGNFWIGASDIKNEGKWVFTDGSSAMQTFWHSGEPNNVNQEDCVVLNWWREASHFWNDFSCSEARNYICMKAATF